MRVRLEGKGELQLHLMRIPTDSRYAGVKALSTGGILLLKDRQAGEAEEFVAPVPRTFPSLPALDGGDDEGEDGGGAVGGRTSAAEEEGAEPEPPEAFQFDEAALNADLAAAPAASA